MDESRKKPWGGRFEEPTDPLVERFTASCEFDRRLAEADIRGSIAHAEMLGRAGIISKEDMERIIRGLEEILGDIRAGRFSWDPALEDVHMNIEKELVRRIGEAGGRLHTARSRNDQVATDLRLWAKGEAVRLDQAMESLQEALLHQAEAHRELIMPGFTHLQHAQPVLWPHHMLAHFEALRRDRERLRDAVRRMDLCPLGSAALAGTGFPVDRLWTAERLGFEAPTRNSMDAVSDRDFVAELLFVLALSMVHLSRLAEELVLWSSSEFSFVELADAYTTGSSIMPQKKNPDVPELVRGKTGRVVGDLVAVLTMLKGLPLTYNRDLQEDKEPLFDAVDTVRDSLFVMAGLVREMRPRPERLREAAGTGFITATDLADRLVRKGIPFRRAHEIVGRAVALAERKGKELHELTGEELLSISEALSPEDLEVLSPEGSVASRRSLGGTAPEEVERALREAREWLEAFEGPCG